MPTLFKSFNPAGNAITTSSKVYVDIPELSIDLSKYTVFNNALIILNLPGPFTVGTNWPTIFFGIALDGTTLVANGYSYNDKAPGAYGSIPITLQTLVNFREMDGPGLVHAQWRAGADGTPTINSYCSISAIIS